MKCRYQDKEWLVVGEDELGNVFIWDSLFPATYIPVPRASLEILDTKDKEDSQPSDHLDEPSRILESK